ncbi:AGAP004618-PA-like protein [Anopheles sinensis]|uniref:AGAP004618-PA-like protein n=1 Tax=Anopheles sinensis TaxID=74873 RepID=A0A084W7V3_ANOSI|nr:AGAP004618-PA-like protein [Anopheles sinensis]
MFAKFILFAVLAQLACAQQPSFDVLVEFGTNFSTLAFDTQEEINELYVFNGDMIREFNRELLLELGRMVPAMREADADLQQQIEAADGVDDECREYVQELRELFLLFQNWDIQDCAYYAHVELEADSINRFLPYAITFQSENTRSISQVVQTLARRNAYADFDGVVEELDGEWEYYQTLAVSFSDFLFDEILAHAPVADRVYLRLSECRETALDLQLSDQEYILSYLDDNCL